MTAESSDHAGPSRVILVAHICVTGPVHELRRYLLGRCRELTYLTYPLQPFSALDDHHSYYEYYQDGQLRQRIAQPQWSLPPSVWWELVHFARHAWLTLWWSATRARRADLFIGLNPLNAWLGLLLQAMGRVRRVVYYTIDYVPQRFSASWLNALYHWVDRTAVRRSDQVWNLSSRMVEAREREGLATRYRAKQHVVPIGTDLSVQPLPAEAVERRTIVYFGNLSEKQGVQLAIEALPFVRRQVPDVRLVVMGGIIPGRLEALRELAALRGVAEAVTFTGVIADHDEALQALRRYAIGVAPYVDSPDNYTRYTDPGKPKAYLAAGLPVVITDLPEIAGTIARAEAGTAIPARVEALAEALIRGLTDDAWFRRAKTNARRLAERFSWHEIFTGAFHQLNGAGTYRPSGPEEGRP